MLVNEERALAVMEQHGLDALVATTPENVYYLSDYAREPAFHTGRDMNGAVLPRSTEIPPTLLVQEFELPALAQQPSWMPEVRVQTMGYTALPEGEVSGEINRRFEELLLEGRRRGSPDRHKLFVETIHDLGLGEASLGVDDLELLNELQGLMPEADLRYAANVFREVRVVKTEKEIEILTHAARIMKAALEAVENIIGEGITCRELVRCFRTTMAAQGAYGSHITYGGGEQPWVGFSDLSYKLKRDDVLYVDPAGEYMHYWTDFGRSAYIGNPSAKFEELHGLLVECHRVAVPLIAPGSTFSDVAAAAAETVKPRMSEGFMVLLHSIGIEQYDHPVTSGAFGGGDLVLEPNMTINFETLYFELGWGVLQLEDTYLVTESGPRQLNQMPKVPLLAPVPGFP